MDQLIFQEKSAKEREQFLSDNATSVEVKTYHRPLDVNEVVKLQGEYAQKAIELSIAEDELKQHRESFKVISKPLKNDMAKLMQSIRSSSEEVTEEVYLLSDMDSQMMGYYNSAGELIYSRPLLKSERQYSIQNVLTKIS